jgi:hypothetical protein
MANSRISELPLKAVPSDDDFVPIVDTQLGGGQTASKKTKFSSFLAGASDAAALYVSEQLGVPGGIASLTADTGKVPAEQLPSYVDDVLEYDDFAALPGIGEAGKIYVTIDTKKTYRWTGSVYVEISSGPSSTDAVPEGSSNLYFTNTRAASAAPVQSVAGKTGAVTLSGSDISAALAGHTTLAEDITGLNSGKAPTTHTHGNLTSDGKIGSTSGLPLITGASGAVTAGSFGTTTGTFCAGNDTRLSNARTPLPHTHGNIDNTGAVGGVQVTTAAVGPLVYTLAGTASRGAFGTSAGTICAGNDSRLSDARTPTAHTHSASDINSGTLSADILPASVVQKDSVGSVSIFGGPTIVPADWAALIVGYNSGDDVTFSVLGSGLVYCTGLNVNNADVDFGAGGTVLYEQAVIDGGSF